MFRDSSSVRFKIRSFQASHTQIDSNNNITVFITRGHIMLILPFLAYVGVVAAIICEINGPGTAQPRVCPSV